MPKYRAVNRSTSISGSGNHKGVAVPSDDDENNRAGAGATLLKRSTIYARAETLVKLTGLAAKLQVSQGSLVDTALCEFLSLPVEQILSLMVKHAHLNTEQVEVVADILQAQAQVADAKLDINEDEDDGDGSNKPKPKPHNKLL